jgi:hypothetical protein
MEENTEENQENQDTQNIPNIPNTPKRKSRILQSTFARLRRQASKFASKKHKMKVKREDSARVDGAEHRLPKQKRHDS